MVVTDDQLEAILNEWTQKGWLLDGINFVPNEASKRPKMAFVVFCREVELPNEGGEG